MSCDVCPLLRHQGAFRLVQTLSKDQRCGRAPFGARERDAFDRLFGGRVPVGTGKAEGSVHCPRAPTLELALSKRKVKRPWCSVSSLSWLAVPGVSRRWFSCPVPAWFLSVFFLLFLFLSFGRGRHVPTPGWEGRRVKREGTDPRNGTGRRPKDRLLQLSLCVRLCGVPRRAWLVLSLALCYFISRSCKSSLSFLEVATMSFIIRSIVDFLHWRYQYSASCLEYKLRFCVQFEWTVFL